MTCTLWISFLGGLLLMSPTSPMQAQVDTVSIAEARRDADGDYVPDRLDDTLVVAGRATVGSRALSTTSLQAFVQHDSSGIMIYGQQGAQPFQAGDSLTVKGVITHYNGMTELRLLDYRVINTKKERVPDPLALSLQEPREPHEGRLVTVEGRVGDKGKNKGGVYLFLDRLGSRSTEPISVYVDHSASSSFNLHTYSIGDRLQVTGLLSQYDFAAPYDDYYQIRPRSSSDIAVLGTTRRAYERLLWMGGGVLLLALIGLGVSYLQARRRKQALSHSEDRFQRFSEATLEGIFFFNKEYILDANTSFEMLTGYSLDEEKTIPPEILLKDDTDNDPSVLYTASDEPHEVLVQRSDGTQFPAELHVRRTTYQHAPAYVAALRDITSRKQHEARLLEAKEQAEEVAHLKTNLLNNLSHELRTPLTAILGFADLIEEEGGPHETRFARHIHQNAQRLLDTLNAMLDMAQLESGTFQLSKRRLNVTKTIRESVALLQPMAERKGLSLDLQSSPDLYADTDPVALQRILDNLIGNAIKFTEEGAVTVSVEASSPEEVRVEVRDTGIGMSTDFQRQLFEAFRQESDGLRRDHTGIGLGLTLTQKLIDQLEGRIVLCSEKGQGSTFSFYLPSCTPVNGRETNANTRRMST